jgi:hypothetical protein
MTLSLWLFIGIVICIIVYVIYKLTQKPSDEELVAATGLKATFVKHMEE